MIIQEMPKVGLIAQIKNEISAIKIEIKLLIFSTNFYTRSFKFFIPTNKPQILPILHHSKLVQLVKMADKINKQSFRRGSEITHPHHPGPSFLSPHDQNNK